MAVYFIQGSVQNIYTYSYRIVNHLKVKRYWFLFIDRVRCQQSYKTNKFAPS